MLKSLAIAQQMQAQVQAQAQAHQAQLQLHMSQLHTKTQVAQAPLAQTLPIPQPLVQNPASQSCGLPSHQTSQDVKEECKAPETLSNTRITANNRSQNGIPNNGKQGKGRTKEEEDAGRTLLGFMSELRKNHDQAISALPTKANQQSHEDTKANQQSHEDVSNTSSSTSPKKRKCITQETEGLNRDMNTGAIITPASSVTQPLSIYSYHRRNQSTKDFETISSLSSTRSSSRYTESASSYGSQNEAFSESGKGSTEGSSEEEAEKLSTSVGPIRKRFRKNDFTSKNVGKHNSRIAEEDLRNNGKLSIERQFVSSRRLSNEGSNIM